MNQKYESFLKGFLDNLTKKKSVFEEKIAQAKKKMAQAAKREQGSWSDHSIRDAEEGIALLIQHLKTVEDQIKEIKSFSRSKISSDKIALGSMVTAEIDGKKQTFVLVGSPVGNLEEGFLSIQSPIGKALVGKKEGQRFTVPLQTGSLEVKVVKLI